MNEHRNTPRDIVFDMEDDIATIRRHANLVLVLSTDDSLENVYQDAFHQVALGLLDCHCEVRDKFKRLFDQIVRADTDTPAPAESFDDLFAAWNTNRKQQHDIGDDEAERLNEQELKLLDKLVTTPATSAGEIAAKVFVAKKLIEQSGSRWTDARDVKVLDSIMEDLTRLGASMPAD